MMIRRPARCSIAAIVLLLSLTPALRSQAVPPADDLRESQSDRDKRMAWWRDARFGMFIHWGLYAIPAGSWEGKTDYGEWIRTSARIPVGVYDTLVRQFNPTRFDARRWARAAREAGMKYIVITSKHHDGFCLFGSRYNDFNVLSTPFSRDVIRELSDACREEGIRFCLYYSIMDWHHPDYLPRRTWETDRSVSGADFERYIAYMKHQLQELLTQYGDIGVLWFDGEWETTWDAQRGRDLYRYVRSLQPRIIVNNRVGAGRSGMDGFSKKGEYAGDFGTPEQEVPPGGLPGVDWETCMTMNDHWGYNSHDAAWKPAAELIRTLADVASKGGNYLLNVGPTASGEFPPEATDRLRRIGDWMRVNGESITGTSAGPFGSLPWGRCTQKPAGAGTRLYLHVFTWPDSGLLVLPGMYNDPRTAWLLTDAERHPLAVTRREDAVIIHLPAVIPDRANSVVVCDIDGAPDVSTPPELLSDYSLFIDSTVVTFRSDRPRVTIRYTTDRSVPTDNATLVSGPLVLKKTTTVTARCFRDGRPVSGSASRTFYRTTPRPGLGMIGNPVPGLTYRYYEGDWDSLPPWHMMTPVKSGIVKELSLQPRARDEYFGLSFRGFCVLPSDGVYEFTLGSDDGSRLRIDDSLVVNNDGLHGLTDRRALVALGKGYHSFLLEYFNKTGGKELHLSVRSRFLQEQEVPAWWYATLPGAAKRRE